MKVLNKRTDVIPPDAVYVGRPSKWGNPYTIESYRTRRMAILFYKMRLTVQVAEGNLDLSELSGKDLVCWCAPLPCHADVLLELANPTQERRGK